MNNYLAILRRADFIDLYKYGFFYLNKDLIVKFDCDFKELSSKYDIYDALFSRMNSFESSFAYLIIHYVKETGEDFSSINIGEVKHIYPFDLEAKKEFENSFDEHIRIDMPLWDDAVSLIKKKQQFNSSMQGAKNVFEIFGLTGIDKCKSVISDDTVEEMLSDVYDNIRPQGDKSIWVYLMRYDRHAFYPKETIGYYMDIVHIICNYMAKQEVEDYQVEETAIFRFLNTYVGQNLKSDKINNLLGQDERAKAFLERIAQFVPEVDFISVAINYLKMKDLFWESFFYDKKFIADCKAAFGESFTLASYMIGVTFEHNKTYSCLYENPPLAIYKTKEEMAAIELRKQRDKERAEREMVRIEEERERERQIEIERRKAKKKGKKGKNIPFGETGVSRGRGGYPVYGESSYEDYHSFIESDHLPPFVVSEPLPSYNEQEYQSIYGKHSTIQSKERKNGKKDSSFSQKSIPSSLFPQAELDMISEDERKLKTFPLTLQRYTPSGKLSTAQKSTVVVKNAAEYMKYMNRKPKEIWKIKK